jgi:hypothetical protein
MKAVNFNPVEYENSGAFCSNPCAGCPTARLISPHGVEAAMTVDEVLTQHPVEEVRTADSHTVYEWGYDADQFRTGFLTDQPIEFDVVYQAVARIANNECPRHPIDKGE